MMKCSWCNGHHNQMAVYCAKVFGLFILVSAMFSPQPTCCNVVYVDGKRGEDNATCLLGFLGYPCRTLNYASNNGLVEDGSGIILSYGIQAVEKDIVVEDIADVTFIGNDTVVNCSVYGTGLTFVNIGNLFISGITFQNCGKLQNSTIVDQNSTVFMFRSAVYILNSTNITMLNSTFSENIGTGLAMINTDGSVFITNVNFSGNSVPRHEQKDYPGGGGIHIGFASCSPGIVTENCHIRNSTYKIMKCVFRNNHASSKTIFTYLNKNGPVLDSLGDGGGLRISIKGNSQNNQFLIDNCTFLSNSAVNGGGMALSIRAESSNNSFHISNAIVEHNAALKGGGGFDFGIFLMALRQNLFSVGNSRFSFNQAEYGGGSRFYSARTPYSFLSYGQNKILFSNCRWEHNEAIVGAAVALLPEAWEILSEGYLPIPHFNNCHFDHNSYWSNYGNNTMVKIRSSGGVLFTDTMSVNFSGSSSFNNNSCSCIHISAAEINVLPNAVVEFCGNSAQKGAAIKSMGYSHVVAFENSTFLFLNNSVSDRGGAIFFYSVNSLDYLNSRKCFFRYFKWIPVDEWRANFTFINNTAGVYGHSIYVTSLESCARAMSTNGSEFINMTAMFPRRTFSFVPSLNSMEHIVTTDPANIYVQGHDHYSTPGSTYHLPIQIVDYFNQEMNFVLLANSSKYITNKFIALTGKINSSVTVSLETDSDSRQVGADIVVNLTECPPGYYWTEPGHCDCIAASSQHKLFGIFACDLTSRRAYLRVGYWAGCLYGSHGPLVTSKCPLGYCNYEDKEIKKSLFLLPSNCSELEKGICSHGKRKGTICGECMEDYSVYFHSDRYKCDKCSYSEYGIVFYALSELLPLTFVFCLVICFDVSLTSGAINSFVLFAQILDTCEVSAYGTENLPSVIKKFSRAYWFLFGFLNLDFFRHDVFSFCLWDKATVLDVLAFKYVTTLYGLLMVCCLYLLLKKGYCNNVLQKLQNSRSEGRYTVTNGLTGFLIFSYSQCAKVSFQILARVKLYSNDESDVENRNVIFLSGNTDFFGLEHMKYAIPALLVSLCIVILPIALTLNPIYHSLKEYFQTKQHFDDLTCCENSLNTSCFLKLQLYSKPIMDSLQACYKDSTRFFAGLMFLYRLLISAAFAFLASDIRTFAALELIICFILVTHSIFQPYKRRFFNVLDTLMFSNLVLINGITLYNSAATQYDIPTAANAFGVIQTILIYIPVMYFLCLVVAKFALYIKRFRRKNRDSRSLDEYSSLIDANGFRSDQFPARMLQEEQMRRNQRQTKAADYST